MRRRDLLAGLTIGALGCGGRQPRPVDFSETNHTYRSGDYDGVRERWTRHGKLIRDIGTVLEIWATFKSWDFRQAFVESYGDVYSLPESERRGLRQAQLEAARSAYEFHVIAQSTDYTWNDLAEEDSVWKVRLADSAGREVAPVGITLEKLPAMFEMRFFPNRTQFSRSYTMKFPREGQGQEPEPGASGGGRRFAGVASGGLRLRIAGPLGRVETVWSAV